MTTLHTSVIVVSRGRPDTLALCLTGLSRLRNASFEIIVVADPAGIAAARALPFAAALKLVMFDRPNISEARNIGIAEAAGDIVAFIDDDAVPEPRWLDHLCAPFADPQVAAAGGYVIGRNGISFQWRARWIDALGTAHPLAVEGDGPCLPEPPASDGAIKTEGTNMAVRREVLAAMGGFDPAYRFYMDETDLNLRLARAGHRTAIVPLAQVHHAYAPSPRRRADRAVTDLHEIGASQMVFLRRHGRTDAEMMVMARVRDEQRRRLLAQMVAGLIEPRDVRHVLEGLAEGFQAGQARSLPLLAPIPESTTPFRPFPQAATNPVETIAGRIWSLRRLKAQAARRCAEGATVSVYAFSPTALFHRVRFVSPGFWLQTGGLWGRSLRSDRLWRPWGFRARLKREVARSALLR